MDTLFDLLMEAEASDDFTGGEYQVGFADTPDIEEAPDQRKIMRRFEGNPVLRAAIDGKRTIEGTLGYLAEKEQYWFPRMKDPEVLDLIDGLGKLITPVERLRPHGLFTLTNFTELFGGSSLFTMYMVNSAAKSLSIYDKIGLGFLTIGGLVFPVCFAYTMLKHMLYLPHPFEEARYIDAKVDEFYRQ